MPSSGNQLLFNAINIIPMLLSLCVHEWAHAYAAWRLGDDTAEREGRLTLNPFVHADPIGTFLLPLLGVPFGWAKPVPVNPARFTRKVSMGTGMAITAFAGPLSNLVLALGISVAMGLIRRFDPSLLLNPGISKLLDYTIILNIGLALFNLLPVPPLDGSRILDRFITARHREQWESFQRLGPLLLIGVFVVGGYILSGPIAAVHGVLDRLISAIAG